MGKGDKKTRRGKIIQGSHGNTRPKKTSINFEKVEKAETPKAKAKK